MSEETDGEGQLAELPEDVLLQLLFCMRAKDVCSLAQVNRRFSELCRRQLVWQKLSERDFGLRHATKEEYLLLIKRTRCKVDFRGRKPVYSGFESVHVGRGVRYNEYDHSSHHFIYPVPSGALFLVFNLPVVPAQGLALSVRHKEFHPLAAHQTFGAFVDILVNDYCILSYYSPRSEVYITETFELPAEALQSGQNTIRWNYRLGSMAYYWIQEAQVQSKANVEPVVRAL
mmetsp:Transcript_457/g.1584  ORF Transcript_457/g.1584 Transcript_457/m.1584 type:complete len:230 (-) Transcript_457:33-722(-)